MGPILITALNASNLCGTFMINNARFASGTGLFRLPCKNHPARHPRHLSKFLNTSATNYFLEEFIKGAKDRLALITPSPSSMAE